MADGPTVVNTGGGAIAGVVVAIIALMIVLFLTGVIDFGSGGGSRNVDVDVNLPKVEAPSAPAPDAPAPAAPAPANGG
jgi:hypothetical protein